MELLFKFQFIWSENMALFGMNVYSIPIIFIVMVAMLDDWEDRSCDTILKVKSLTT